MGVLIVGLLAGLGFAIADTVQSSGCSDADTSCALATFTLGGLIGAVIGIPVAAALLRLGWEWALLCLAVVLWMPVLLDTGAWAWLLVVVGPVLAGLITWTGTRRPVWRPVVVAAVGGLGVLSAVLVTFVLP